jgi:hypothetical protein
MDGWKNEEVVFRWDSPSAFSSTRSPKISKAILLNDEFGQATMWYRQTAG